MFKNVKAQIERKNDLITRAESLVNTAESEKRELTDAEAQELAEIRDDVKKIKEMLEIVDDIDGARNVGSSAEGTSGEGEGRACGEDKERAEMEERAFDNYLRGTIVHERAGELAPANNGAIIPTTISRKIIEMVYDICPILARSEKFNVGGKFEIPYYPADASVDIAVDYKSEFSALTSSTGNFGTIELSGFLAGALTKVSRSLVNNTDFNLVAFVVRRMAYAISRWIEKESLKGTPDKIEGLSGATNVLTLASSSVIEADDLIDLQDKVKDVFQNDAIWIMSTATRTALRKLKDDIGRYLLIDDIASPWGKSLLGKPVYVSDNMDNIGAGKAVIYYGDFSGLATKFSEDISVEVLRERFADEHAIGVIGWVEFDAKVQDQQKIAVLKMHA